MANKCRDPCPGTCGSNAKCQTIHHMPMCTCLNGYTGDPFNYCKIIQTQRKCACLTTITNFNFND